MSTYIFFFFWSKKWAVVLIQYWSIFWVSLTSWWNLHGFIKQKNLKKFYKLNPCYGLGMSAGVDLLREQRPSMEAVISSFLCSFILIKPQKIKPNKTTPNIWWVRELFPIFVDGTWDFIHTAKCVPAQAAAHWDLKRLLATNIKYSFLITPPAKRKITPLHFLFGTN